MKKALLILGIAVAMGACAPEKRESTLGNAYWEVQYDHKGITGLISPRDSFKANVLSGRLDADVRFRMNEGEWQTVFKRLSEFYRPPENEPTYARKLQAGKDMVQVIDYKPGMPFSLEQTFRFQGAALEWDIVLENRMFFPVEVGDVFISFPSSGAAGPTQAGLFEGGYLRHQFISGDGSFLLFTKRSGAPPYLLITVKPGTGLERMEGSNYYIHPGGPGRPEKDGKGQEPARAALAPKGQGNDKLSYGFKLHWADTYSELRDLLYENGLIDVRVVPGMTIPEDLEAMFSLRTRSVIDSVAPEFPEETELTYLGEPQPDHHLYKVKFHRPGENGLTIHFDGGRKTVLDFFSTEPVETLLAKRSAFIVKNQQHRNPDLWYDGLFSIWDMRNRVLRGPDNTDEWKGWDTYRVACDDWVLGIAPFLASVNALFPDENQIKALEYYLEHHVWGGLQRSDVEEPYPYGIYGVPTSRSPGTSC